MAASSRAARKRVSVISSVKCLPTLRRPSTLPTRTAMRAWPRRGRFARAGAGARVASAREHPAIAARHHARDREPLADLLDLRRQGLGVPGVAFKHFDRDGAAVAVGQEPEDDLQLVALAIARVAE